MPPRQVSMQSLILKASSLEASSACKTGWVLASSALIDYGVICHIVGHRLDVFLAIVRYFKRSRRYRHRGCDLSLMYLKRLSFHGRRPRIRELLVRCVSLLLSLPACIRVKLDLEQQPTVRI